MISLGTGPEFGQLRIIDTCCQHSGYSFILSDTVRRCVCRTCGHKWTVVLGSGMRNRDNETDYIPNQMSGVEFAAMRGNR